ncbi:PH domain-containing protein [Rhodocaloribacter litoris]|uniref:PH domain-containing protein n=1 Tax=Rhodocaloribacter litoris TaxID=2558931 RepID=UPI001420635D|nr:PH domain-containing protein [Rhodocaloribacter litoris]QXD14617.1 PH domain-containing protein [Rhodocaloribacter litoris]GIV59611.1 MAG: membrane protein [Rhodothermaceae bacterium]
MSSDVPPVPVLSRSDGQGSSPVDPASYREARRLHPLTLVQRLVVSLPALFFLLLPFLRHPDRDAWINLVIAIIYGVIALPWIVLYYHRFRYRITPRELIIESGVLTRKHRNIPIERIQSIEIEQRLLARLLGLAKVKVQTAGSAATEGVLEYVSVPEAHAIRRIVRVYQQHRTDAPEAAAGPPATTPETGEATPETTGLSLSLRRVLLSGAFRFSLLYIAVAFSLLQYFDPDPEAIALWLSRGALRPLITRAADAPWLTAFLFALLAALLSWLTGIAVNLGKYYGFRLWYEPGKLHKRHGLLTVSENTIPFRKVQALILRTNPLMQRFGWWELKLQTMGFDPREQGYQVAAPFARLDEIEAVARPMLPFHLPETFRSVSPLHARRVFVRWTLALLLLSAGTALFWTPAWWSLTALPLVGLYAWLAFRRHGYVFTGERLFVRRGVLRHHVWVLPVEKFQVFYLTASLFQRRLGLCSVYVDTAGVAGFAAPVIHDLPAGEAEALLETLYARFQAHYAGAEPPGAEAGVEAIRSRSEQSPR